MAGELTIGEVARRSGVASSALRFYERRGLIAAARTDGNQRRYDRSVLRRIAFVQAGRAAGITLTEIGAALDGLDARIETLQALRNRLSTCIGCGCLSIDRCDLLNPDDEAAAQGPGAHYLSTESARA
jgi:MerR family transcriptional regulator, redox-sensitive transcriptional activator SoxR